MKNYTRKQISTDDIDAYSMCPKFYELSQDKVETVDEDDDTIFNTYIKETILQMHIMELSTGHKTEFHSVKIFFDKVFWKSFTDDILVTKALEYSERGLDILHKYHSTVYSMSRNKIVAVKAPYDYTLNSEKIAVPAELEVISVDKENDVVYLMVFTDKESVAAIREDAITSACNMVKMSAIFKETPSNHTVKATFYNAEKNIGCTFDVTNDMVNEIDRQVKYLAQGIHNKVYYKSKTDMCNECKYIKECDKE